MNGVSEGVLEALARALQLDEAERAHLLDLARAAQPAGLSPRRRQTRPSETSPSASRASTSPRTRAWRSPPYTAEPGSRSEEALNLLGSWAATVDRAEPARATDQT